MSKIYIDFDGVILDTWDVIFKKYYEKYNTTNIKENNIKKMMLNIGWNYILENSEEINYSLEKIKKLSKVYNIYILSKVNSKQEQDAKTNFLLKNNIKKMYFVPYNSSKIEYVNPNNNILVDDEIKNLEEWEQYGGTAIFFNKNLDKYDSYGNKNKKYLTINDLLKICDIM